MEILPVGAELFHVDGKTNKHDKTNSFFFNNFANMPKNWVPFTICYSFIPLACAECDDSLPFSGASSICYYWAHNKIFTMVSYFYPPFQLKWTFLSSPTLEHSTNSCPSAIHGLHRSGQKRSLFTHEIYWYSVRDSQELNSFKKWTWINLFLCTPWTGLKVQLQSFLISALDGGQLSASCPGHFTHRKTPNIQRTEEGVGSTDSMGALQRK